MDVYHKVLVRLYEATGGRDTQTVDFKELVKSLGFHGNYEDIYQRLSVQGWIVETSKANFVKISHWGVKEAQESVSGAPAPTDSSELKKSADRLIKEAKELQRLVEAFAADASAENLEPVERKIAELNSAIAGIKESI
jgi:hypothetical protein